MLPLILRIKMKNKNYNKIKKINMTNANRICLKLYKHKMK